MSDSSYPTKITVCPWLGLCDDAIEVVGRKESFCQSNHENCPTFNDESGTKCLLCGGLGQVHNADLWVSPPFRCPECKGTGYNTSPTKVIEE